MSAKKMRKETADDAEQLFVPDYQKREKCVSKRWAKEENIKYMAFLREAQQDFTDEYNRRVKKVFKRLSEFVGSKNQNQCKSHHQKMMGKYKTFQNLFVSLAARIAKEELNEEEESMSTKESQMYKASDAFNSKVLQNPNFQDDLFTVLDL